VRAPSQRRALGVLFLGLFVVFAGVAWAAAGAGVWPVAVAAAVLGLWLATLGIGALRPRRTPQ
jgi:Flp pilus assembly protein TadB